MKFATLRSCEATKLQKAAFMIFCGPRNTAIWWAESCKLYKVGTTCGFVFSSGNGALQVLSDEWVQDDEEIGVK